MYLFCEQHRAGALALRRADDPSSAPGGLRAGSGRRVAEMRMQLRFMKASSPLYQETGAAAQAP